LVVVEYKRAEVKCTKCPLYKTSIAGNFSAVKVDGAGNKQSEIMLVGEALGYDEVTQRTPFVGRAGKLLRKYLQSVGITDKNAFFTNVCKCRPPDNRPPHKTEMRECFTYLDEEIKEIKPKVIGVLGNTACKAFEISSQITTIHGNEVWSEKYNCWLLPLYHPSYVMRFTNEARQRTEFVKDLGKLATLVETKNTAEITNYKVANSIDKVEKAINYLCKQPWVAFDIETDRFDFLNSAVVAISFSAKSKTAIVIPFQHPKVFNKEEQDKVRELLIKFFSSDVLKIAQNGKFDMKHLMAKGIEVKKFAFDTMLAHYLLDELGMHNLGALTQTYTDMQLDKNKLDEYIKTKEDTNNILNAPLNLLYEYSAGDADATYRVFLKLRELITKEELDTVFYKIVMPLSYVLSHMEFTGVEVDKEYIDKITTAIKYKLKTFEGNLQRDKYVAEFKKKYDTEELNFKSPKQLRELLYDVMEIKPISFTKPSKTNPRGNPSTDAQTLEDLAKLTKFKVLEDLINLRKLKKLEDYISSYKKLSEESKDNRIHTIYYQAGTRTGRLSSSNPNLQNIPSMSKDPNNAKLVRNCLVATKGNILIEADYSQVEFRVWGDNSNDTDMIGAINNKEFDIHTQIASRVFGIPIENVTEQKRRIAKGVVYGLMYGRGTYSQRQQIGWKIILDS